ncbi:hypothetical protein K8O84_24830 [Cupriavidus pauculus]|uniref:hypothetical protein n=1 Tax=Cupriavidus pauculus TaxID=82633 RepID=UPI001CBD1101|nr:hypothetical protein [Cupriavidus pauculus]UAL02033.1 hypothetical protein K8O84_24830 [Cupriavidus pauculus]
MLGDKIAELQKSQVWNDPPVAASTGGEGFSWSDIGQPRTQGERYADAFGGEAINTSDRSEFGGGQPKYSEYTRPDGLRVGRITDVPMAATSAAAEPTLPEVTVSAKADQWVEYGPGGEVTVHAKRMTPEEMAAFDAENSPGEIRAIEPDGWERFWGDPNLQHVMQHTATGKVLGAVVNAAGSLYASFAPSRYNFATLQTLNPVQQRNARIDNVIGLATLPLTTGSVVARAEVAVARADAAALAKDALVTRMQQTGARQVLNPDALSSWDRAEAAYANIRGDATDIGKIAANTGWSEARIGTVKEHLFFNEHKLDSGFARFDADPDIVNAWNRLATGEPPRV